MERKSFLKRLIIGTAAIVAAPVLTSAAVIGDKKYGGEEKKEEKKYSNVQELRLGDVVLVKDKDHGEVVCHTNRIMKQDGQVFGWRFRSINDPSKEYCNHKEFIRLFSAVPENKAG